MLNKIEREFNQLKGIGGINYTETNETDDKFGGKAVIGIECNLILLCGSFVNSFYRIKYVKGNEKEI